MKNNFDILQLIYTNNNMIITSKLFYKFNFLINNS